MHFSCQFFEALKRLSGRKRCGGDDYVREEIRCAAANNWIYKWNVYALITMCLLCKL